MTTGEQANADEPERWEISRAQQQPGPTAGFLGAGHLILSAPLRFVLRRAVGDGPFQDIPGAITLSLIAVPYPPPGHPPVAVRFECAANLLPVNWTPGMPDRRRSR